ncbi:MAG: outer membrane beta-barrel protein [Janthinobacterium lividum]
MLVLASFLASAHAASAQATYTASRAGDLQLGAGVELGNSNYLSPELGGTGERLRGFGLYSTFDLRKHLGVELDFKQVSPSYGQDAYERTYELGGRYVYPLGRLRPYGKVLYGRGVFNYPRDIANLAYNLSSVGVGLDYRLSHQVNARVDYEHQHWFGFPLQPLTPNVVSVGIAYHFSGEGQCKYCAQR